MSSQAKNNKVKYPTNLIDRVITAIVRPDVDGDRHNASISDNRAALVRSGLLSLYN